jgi:IS1 family transposase/transposase-like protein
VNCYCCNGKAQKFGFFRNRNRFVQRYRCPRCAKTFCVEQPLDGVRIEAEKAYQVIGLLIEGMGIRAIQRLTGLHQETILNILAAAGQQCARLLNERMRDLKVEACQVDEMFAFVGCKDVNNRYMDYNRGSQYLFTGMDAHTKLIVSHIIGKRDSDFAGRIVRDLQHRIVSKFQLTTDGFGPYATSVKYTFGRDLDFAQLIKLFANPVDGQPSERRYSPSHCIGTRVLIRSGQPDFSRISTSYIERQNLNVRLFNRRFTRLTLGYSKKIEYLRHSAALFVAYHNFCRVHSTLKTTPAVAAGLENRVWTIKDLVKIDCSTI